jgi:hypothetical protein
MTGAGRPEWTVEKDDTAPSKPNVLKQSGTMVGGERVELPTSSV